MNLLEGGSTTGADLQILPDGQEFTDQYIPAIIRHQTISNHLILKFNKLFPKAIIFCWITLLNLPIFLSQGNTKFRAALMKADSGRILRNSISCTLHVLADPCKPSATRHNSRIFKPNSYKQIDLNTTGLLYNIVTIFV